MVCPPAHELAWCYDVVITTIQRLSSDWSMRGDPLLAERMVLLKVGQGPACFACWHCYHCVYLVVLLWFIFDMLGCMLRFKSRTEQRAFVTTCSGPFKLTPHTAAAWAAKLQSHVATPLAVQLFKNNEKPCCVYGRLYSCHLHSAFVKAERRITARIIGDSGFFHYMDINHVHVQRGCNDNFQGICCCVVEFNSNQAQTYNDLVNILNILIVFLILLPRCTGCAC